MGDNFERNRNGKKSYHPDRPLEKFCHEDSGRKGRVDPSQSLLTFNGQTFKVDNAEQYKNMLQGSDVKAFAQLFSIASDAATKLEFLNQNNVS